MARGQFGRPVRMRDFKKTIDIAKGVPPAWGLRRRYPGASALMDPSDITRNFGSNPSDPSRQGFIDHERELSNRYAMLRRRRKSGDRFKAAGYL